MVCEPATAAHAAHRAPGPRCRSVRWYGAASGAPPQRCAHRIHCTRWRCRCLAAAAPDPDRARRCPASVADRAGAAGAARHLATERLAHGRHDGRRDQARHRHSRRAGLRRSDISGKTGTTNEARDTWFNGFNRNIVATVWVGFDQERPLGEGEEGSRTAVPIWINFMREALRGTSPTDRGRCRRAGDRAHFAQDRYAGRSQRGRCDLRDLHGRPLPPAANRGNTMPGSSPQTPAGSSEPCSDDTDARPAPQGSTMTRRASPRKDNLRRALAQEAARIMAQHGIHDFLTAKRKAAERLGVRMPAPCRAIPRSRRRWPNTSACSTPAATNRRCRRSAARRCMRCIGCRSSSRGWSVRCSAAPPPSMPTSSCICLPTGPSTWRSSSWIAASRTRSPSGACGSTPSASRPIRDCALRSTTAGRGDGVSARWHPPGAGEPGRWQADAPRRRGRDSGLAAQRHRHVVRAARRTAPV
jgi:hypothetical protein